MRWGRADAYGWVQFAPLLICGVARGRPVARAHCAGHPGRGAADRRNRRRPRARQPPGHHSPTLRRATAARRSPWSGSRSVHGSRSPSAPAFSRRTASSTVTVQRRTSRARWTSCSRAPTWVTWELGSQVIIVPRAPAGSPAPGRNPRRPGGSGGRGRGPQIEPAAAEPVGETAASDAYLDETARRLILGARAARDAALSDIRVLYGRRQGAQFLRVLDAGPRPAHRAAGSRPPAFAGRGTSPRFCGCWDPAWKSVGQRFRPGRPEGLAARFAADPARDPFSLFIVSGLGPRAAESWFRAYGDPARRGRGAVLPVPLGRHDLGALRGTFRTGGERDRAPPRPTPRAGLRSAVDRPRDLRGGANRLSPRKAHRFRAQLSPQERLPAGHRRGISRHGAGRCRDAFPAPSGIVRPDIDYGLNAAMGTQLEIGVPVAVVDYSFVEPPLLASEARDFCTLHHRWRPWDAEDSERVTVRGFHDWEFEIERVSTGAPNPPDPVRATAELVESWREEGDTVVVKDGSQPDSGPW